LKLGYKEDKSQDGNFCPKGKLGGKKGGVYSGILFGGVGIWKVDPLFLITLGTQSLFGFWGGVKKLSRKKRIFQMDPQQTNG